MDLEVDVVRTKPCATKPGRNLHGDLHIGSSRIKHFPASWCTSPMLLAPWALMLVIREAALIAHIFMKFRVGTLKMYHFVARLCTLEMLFSSCRSVTPDLGWALLTQANTAEPVWHLT